MDYTQSIGATTDATTGKKKHVANQAVPTEWSEKDANSIIWSMMEVLAQARLPGQQFNAGNAQSYQVLRDAINASAAYHGFVNLGRFAQDLYLGNPVLIECFGDSTYSGADPLNNLISVAVPAPLQLQNTLREYYANTAATVVNRAISGTNSAQMLAGTDGSGAGFEQRIISSSAQVVFCNHCINDAQVSSPTPPQVYRSNLVEIVQICRRYGKSIVFETPNPYFASAPYGAAGQKSEAVKQYAGIMRQVAREMGIPLVDNFELCERYLMGGNRADLFIPDGVHPTVAGYLFKGTNMALPFITPERVDANDQIISAVSSAICSSGSNESFLTVPVTKGGIYRAVAANKSIRLAVFVTRAGMDLSVGHPVWGSGSNGITVTLDGQTLTSNLNQSHPGVVGGNVIFDYETTLIEGLQPGFHIVTLTWPGAGAGGGIYYYRLKQSHRRKTFRSSTGGASQPSAAENRRSTLMLKQELTGNGIDNNICTILFDELSYSPNVTDIEFEFEATLNKGEFFVVSGYQIGPASGAGTPVAHAGLAIGLDKTTGRLSAAEDNGAATNYLVMSALGATDISTQLHTYYCRWTKNGGSFGQLVVYMDSALIGAYNLTNPLRGGVFGLLRINRTGIVSTMTIDKLFLINR